MISFGAGKSRAENKSNVISANPASEAATMACRPTNLQFVVPSPWQTAEAQDLTAATAPTILFRSLCPGSTSLDIVSPN